MTIANVKNGSLAIVAATILATFVSNISSVYAVYCNKQEAANPGPACGAPASRCIDHQEACCPIEQQTCNSGGLCDRGVHFFYPSQDCNNTGQNNYHCQWAAVVTPCHNVYTCEWRSSDNKCVEKTFCTSTSTSYRETVFGPTSCTPSS